MAQANTPLTPADSDLRDFPHTPLFRARLFGSSFHARASDGEWRAGVTLWLKSWDQVPAGSLPNDDVELCRLAELARDLKTWKKAKDGAMRGWVLCTDGRMYHPVVAEGVNTALEAKIKQRLKTAKARIGALEKHLKEAKTESERERIKEEIRRVQQTLSQGLSQTQSLAPREGEEKEKEKGLNSVPNGTDGDAVKAPADLTKDELWSAGKSLLAQAGIPAKQCGSFVGGLVKQFGDQVVIDAVRLAVVTRPADPVEYLKATCMRSVGQRIPVNKQEALEERGQRVVDEWANSGVIDAAA